MNTFQKDSIKASNGTQNPSGAINSKMRRNDTATPRSFFILNDRLIAVYPDYEGLVKI